MIFSKKSKKSDFFNLNRIFFIKLNFFELIIFSSKKIMKFYYKIINVLLFFFFFY